MKIQKQQQHQQQLSENSSSQTSLFKVFTIRDWGPKRKPRPEEIRKATEQPKTSASDSKIVDVQNPPRDENLPVQRADQKQTDFCAPRSEKKPPDDKLAIDKKRPTPIGIRDRIKKNVKHTEQMDEIIKNNPQFFEFYIKKMQDFDNPRDPYNQVQRPSLGTNAETIEIQPFATPPQVIRTSTTRFHLIFLIIL